MIKKSNPPWKNHSGMIKKGLRKDQNPMSNPHKAYLRAL